MDCCCYCKSIEHNLDPGIVEDKSAANLSYVGEAAYHALRIKHWWFHHRLWNVTSGKVVGELHQTPKTGWKSTRDPPAGHDEWFPQKMGEIMARTEIWCDLLSLGPPDGLFLVEIKKALAVICERSLQSPEPIVIRMMFGNVVGMPVNCEKVIKSLTEHLPRNANIRLWVGAWRKGVSWNHAKIIAVDGRYLHTGGHNMWDCHYLKDNPVHDLSLEMVGNVAHDGHLFANDQWSFIELRQRTAMGWYVDKLPDWIPMLLLETRVTVSEFPRGKAAIFPPKYERSLVPHRERPEGAYPVITMGRYGTLVRRLRASDDAILAMVGAARTIIHLAIQDIGPVCVPGTKIALPGCVWPKQCLKVIAKVIWEKGVDVEIALSNPNSIPSDLGPTEANYGNGWSCVDVAAEIIKMIKKLYPKAKDEDLRKIVRENLRICFIREAIGNAWENGKTMGMHAKHFIIDDILTYVGSQNLYICDLAEWGVAIDDEGATKQMMEEYWNPMWEASYKIDDCNVDEVMDSLDIVRDGEKVNAVSPETQKLMEEAARRQSTAPAKNNEFYDTSGTVEPVDLRSSLLNK